MNQHLQKFRGATAAARVFAWTTAVMLCASAASFAAGKLASKGSADDLGLTPANERRADALAHYSAALAAEMRGDIDEALDHYRKVVELDPEAISVHNQIVELLLRRKTDPAGALAHLESAVKKNPKNFDMLFQLGVVYQEMKRPANAITAFEKAIEADPSRLIAYWNLASVYISQRDMNAAVRTLDRAAKQKSDNPGFWNRLGDYYMTLWQQDAPAAKEQQLAAKMLAVYDKALALAPKEPSVLLRVAKAHVLNKNYPKAIEFYTAFLTEKPDELDVRAELAFVYRDADQKDKAIAEWDKLIEKQPGNWQLYRLKAELLDSLKQFDAAAENYRKSIHLNPDALELYLAQTLSLIRAKKPDDARATLEQAKEKFPTSFQVPYFYGLLYSDTKEYDKAVAGFTLAEQLAKEDKSAQLDDQFYFYFGAAQERSGNLEKAAEKFKKTLELNPKSHEALNYLGYMWADRGMKLEESLGMIKKALDLDPDSGAYLDSLGWVYYKLGKYNEALAALRRAVDKMKEGDATVFSHFGDVLDKVGRKQEAITYWKKAVELEPKNEEFTRKLQKALEPSSQVTPSP